MVLLSSHAHDRAYSPGNDSTCLFPRKYSNLPFWAWWGLENIYISCQRPLIIAPEICGFQAHDSHALDSLYRNATIHESWCIHAVNYHSMCPNIWGSVFACVQFETKEIRVFWEHFRQHWTMHLSPQDFSVLLVKKKSCLNYIAFTCSCSQLPALSLNYVSTQPRQHWWKMRALQFHYFSSPSVMKVDVLMHVV